MITLAGERVMLAARRSSQFGDQERGIELVALTGLDHLVGRDPERAASRRRLLSGCEAGPTGRSSRNGARLSRAYRVGNLTTLGALVGLPYAEELARCLRANRTRP